jgi:hypothetical protein
MVSDAKDMWFKNLVAKNLAGSAITISQCTRFDGAPGDGNCTNSAFQISDITIENLKGTTTNPTVVSLQCSAVAPCTNITLLDYDLRLIDGTVAPGYLCGNVVSPRGWACNGQVCETGSAIGDCASGM